MRVKLASTLIAISLFISMVQLLAADNVIVIGLIGDSTVAEQSGWGPAFASRFNKSVKVLNFAKNGATAPSLFKRLDVLLEQKPDYVFVQFGHNDQKRFKPNEYRDNLKVYIDKIKKAKAIPVMISSVTRRSFDDNGKIVSLLLKSEKYSYKANLTVYAETVKSLAKKLKLDFIDLHALSIAHHNKVGPAVSMSYNFKAGDTTHFNEKGAQAIAAIVIEEVKSILPEVALYIN